MANKYVALLLVVCLMVAGGVDAKTREECTEDCSKNCEPYNQFFCRFFCPLRCLDPNQNQLSEEILSRKLHLFAPGPVEGPEASVEGPEASVFKFFEGLDPKVMEG